MVLECEFESRRIALSVVYRDSSHRLRKRKINENMKEDREKLLMQNF